jgi:hypothetical protein
MFTHRVRFGRGVGTFVKQRPLVIPIPAWDGSVTIVYFAESAEQFPAMLVRDPDAKRPHSMTREIG